MWMISTTMSSMKKYKQRSHAQALYAIFFLGTSLREILCVFIFKLLRRKCASVSFASSWNPKTNCSAFQTNNVCSFCPNLSSLNIHNVPLLWNHYLPVALTTASYGLWKASFFSWLASKTFPHLTVLFRFPECIAQLQCWN